MEHTIKMDYDDSDFDNMTLEVLEDGLVLMHTIMRVCSSTFDFFNHTNLRVVKEKSTTNVVCETDSVLCGSYLAPSKL